MKEIFDALSNFGFPVVVSIYLLFRFENKLEKVEAVIQSLREEIKTLSTIIESQVRRK